MNVGHISTGGILWLKLLCVRAERDLSQIFVRELFEVCSPSVTLRARRGRAIMVSFKIELMHMVKKGQLVGEEGVKGLTPAEQFYALAA